MKKTKKQTTKTAKKNPKANPFKEGSVYNIIFREGAKGFTDLKKFKERVAKLAKDTPEHIGYGLAVMCRPSHPSNKNRSDVEVWEIKGVKTWKLVAIAKK